jgi:hypothetical protein
VYNIFSIIPYDVGVEVSVSIGQDVIGWRKSKSTGKTFCEKVIASQFAEANDGILAVHDPALDKTNIEKNFEIKNKAKVRKLHRMAKVQDFLVMWLCSQYLCGTQKESHAQLNRMPAVGYISDRAKIVKAFWSLFQHDGAAAFEWSETSSLPPALSAKDFPGEQT